MSQCGLSDIWRFKFPHTRAYSFFSNVHHTYTRIDYFLLDNRLLPKVKTCTYNSIVISDHSAILFDLDLPNKIKFFLETNVSPEISQATLWETLKVYLRGQIIAYSSTIRKEKNSKLHDISQQILDIDSKYAQSPAPDLYKERLRLQTEYNLLSTDEAMRLILKSRHNVYEFGNKSSRLLAMQAHQAAATRSITKIRSHTGDMNKAFLQFYSNLYTSECSNDPGPPYTFF